MNWRRLFRPRYRAGGEHPTYHDLHVTTADIPRTSIAVLRYGLEVGVTRVGAWRLWDHYDERGRFIGGQRGEPRLIAGEYDGPDMWLILDVAGTVIVNSRDRKGEGDD